MRYHREYRTPHWAERRHCWLDPVYDWDRLYPTNTAAALRINDPARWEKERRGADWGAGRLH